MHHCLSPLIRIPGDCSLFGPRIREAQRYHNPHPTEEVVKIVKIRPNAAFPIAPRDHREDMHQEKQKKREPTDDSIVYPVVERREDRKHR
jgi:hypothetical protein